MPIYVFRCTGCGTIQEELRNIGEGNEESRCAFCGGESVRAHDKENVVLRPDLEPHFNESLGEHIGSRREMRDAMAFHNAENPDFMMGGYPSDGRLTKEERVEVADKRAGVLGKRDDPGWGVNPAEEEEDSVIVDGEADYEVIKQSIRNQHAERRAKE